MEARDRGHASLGANLSSVGRRKVQSIYQYEVA